MHVGSTALTVKLFMDLPGRYLPFGNTSQVTRVRWGMIDDTARMAILVVAHDKIGMEK